MSYGLKCPFVLLFFVLKVNSRWGLFLDRVGLLGVGWRKKLPQFSLLVVEAPIVGEQRDWLYL